MELSDLIAYAVGVEQLNHLRWNFNDVLKLHKAFYSNHHRHGQCLDSSQVEVTLCT